MSDVDFASKKGEFDEERILKKRTQQVSDNVGSEVRSRDLGLRTAYFQGKAGVGVEGVYISILCPSKLSGKGFDQTDQNEP